MNAFSAPLSGGTAATAYLAGKGHYADRSRYPLPILMPLDLKLPRRSGLEVLAWLRQRPGLKRLPVIVFTTRSSPPMWTGPTGWRPMPTS